jgi:hypothetical protein
MFAHAATLPVLKVHMLCNYGGSSSVPAHKLTWLKGGNG